MAYQQTTIKRQDPDEGSVDVFAVKDDATGDIYTKTNIQKEADDWGISYVEGLKNEKNGNVYEISYDVNDDNYSYYPGKLLVSGDALKNPDIQSLMNSGENFRAFSSNPGAKYGNYEVAQQLYDLKQSNPDAYYNQLATDLGNQIFQNMSANKNQYNDKFNKQLNEIKGINPSAYYSAQLGILGSDVGWQIGQNRSDRNPALIEKIQSLIPDAMAAGLTNEQINSIVNNKANSANIENQTRIANEAASPGGFNFGRDLAPALAIFGSAVGGAALGGAFSGAEAAGSGFGLTGASGAGGSMGAGSSLQLTPAFMGAGSGVGGGIVAPSLATGLGVGAGGVLGAGAISAETAALMEAINAGTGYGINASQVPNLTGGLEVGTGGVLGQNPFSPGLEQMGPTYQELGVTGVEGGQMGPTYGELGYTGLNQAEAIAAADAAAAAAGSSGLPSVSDIAKGVTTGQKLANALTGGTQTGTGTGTGTNTAQQLASLLGNRQPVTAALPGIYNMNQNPFSFGNAVPLTSGAYDVSGGTGTTLSNQKLANLLK
jgi:hypothetical protein